MTSIDRVVLSGATGFLGRHIASRLRQRRVATTALVRSTSASATVDHELQIGSDLDLVASIVEQNPDAIVHVAATGGVDDDVAAFSAVIRSNVTLGTLLMEAASQVGCPFIAIGSYSQRSVKDGLVHPNSYYAASKDALESFAAYYCAVRNLSATFLLPTDIYGESDERGRLLTLLAESTRDNTPVEVTAGEQIVSFVHVEDVVGAVLHVLDAKPTSNHKRLPQHFGVTGPEIGTLREIVECISSELKVTIPVVWGKRPYRSNEVLVPDILPLPPGWLPSRSVIDGFRSLLEEPA